VLTTHPLLVPRSRECRAISLPPSGLSSLLGGVFTFSISIRSYCRIYVFLHHSGGRDSVFGVATGYDLDGPGIIIPEGERFCVSFRRVPRPTKPPVQWVPFLF
jgi:hypothetical protein